MNYRQIFTLLMLAGCAAAVVAPAFAQQAPGVTPKTAELKIFKLVHMRPADASAMLSELYRDVVQKPGNPLRFAIDQRTNSLIATGDRELLRVVEALLLRLDTPQKSEPTAKMKTVVFQLKNISASDAIAAAAALGLEDTRMQADAVSNSLVVYGPAEAISQVKELIQELDNSRSSDRFEDFVFRVVWLVDSSLMPDDAAPIPEDLRSPIAKLSKKVGMGELRTAAQMVINVGQTEMGTFGATGSARLERPCIFEFEGTLEARTGRLKVQISAQETGAEAPLCTLRTIIKTPPGHPIILGMTPIDSKASVFVVEMMEKTSDNDAK